MANSINGLVGEFSQVALKQLVAAVPSFDAWMTNLNPGGTNVGKDITALLPTSSTAANDSAGGFAYQDATSNGVTITFQQRDVFHKFTELQWQNLQANQAAKVWIPNIVGTVINDLAQSGSQLFTPTNYPNFQSSSVAGFSGSAVTHIAQLMSTAKVPYGQRTILALPTAYEPIVNSLYQYQTAGTTEFVSNYRVSRGIFGFDIWEYPLVANMGNGVFALAVGPNSACYAFKPPAPPDDPGVFYSTADDPSSGASIQVRTWHDRDGYYKFGGTAVFGTQKGNVAAAFRIGTG